MYFVVTFTFKTLVRVKIMNLNFSFFVFDKKYHTLWIRVSNSSVVIPFSKFTQTISYTRKLVAAYLLSIASV